MKHDESALVKQALWDARDQLQRTGRILPAAYMLVANNPQTGAPLTHPTAIGSVRDEPFSSQSDYDEYLATLRAESKRLAATAVALAAEAQAEVETSRGVEARRVWYLRIEDHLGIEQMHASIDTDENGQLRLGTLLAEAGAADVLADRILPAAPRRA